MAEENQKHILFDYDLEFDTIEEACLYCAENGIDMDLIE